MTAHVSVLMDEVLGLLAPAAAAGGVVVDCTLGGGGHAEALLRALPQATLIGFDRDADALQRCERRLMPFAGRVELVHSDYKRLRAVIEKKTPRERVAALVADFGLSSDQLADPARGFSFSADGPLDMRMDRSAGPTAADLLRGLPEAELVRILRDGDEPHARRIAQAIVRRRREEPVTTTADLAALVASVKPRERRPGFHPATLTFQALRMEVNGELSGLSEFVRDAADVLAAGGRMAFISFHGGEDRAVKNALRDLAGRCTCPPEAYRCECGRPATVRILTRKPVRPGTAEIERNPRSRSARLRAAERIAESRGATA